MIKYTLRFQSSISCAKIKAYCILRLGSSVLSRAYHKPAPISTLPSHHPTQPDQSTHSPRTSHRSQLSHPRRNPTHFISSHSIAPNMLHPSPTHPSYPAIPHAILNWTKIVHLNFDTFWVCIGTFQRELARPSLKLRIEWCVFCVLTHMH